MLGLLVGLSRIVRLNLTHIRLVLLPVAACIAVLLKYFHLSKFSSFYVANACRRMFLRVREELTRSRMDRQKMIYDFSQKRYLKKKSLKNHLDFVFNYI